MKGDPAEVQSGPAVRWNDQRIGGTRCRTRHIGAGDASHLFHFEKWRPRRQPAFGANELDGRWRAGWRTLAAARTRGEELHLGTRAGRADIPFLDDPLFGGARHVIQRATKGLLEKRAPIARGQLHLMTGENETMSRLKPTVLSRCANAHWASLTISGKSMRDVKVVVPIR